VKQTPRPTADPTTDPAQVSTGPVLAPLRSEFADDPEMSELVQLFVGELPARLDAMASAWEQGDVAALRRLTHQLKGAGAGYGFPAVGKAAGEVEKAVVAFGGGIPEAEVEKVRQKVDELLALCRRAASA
jgi:HPt (histidine-containing phosphotransfer) domain-containing protein